MSEVPLHGYSPDSGYATGESLFRGRDMMTEMLSCDSDQIYNFLAQKILHNWVSLVIVNYY